MRLLFLLNRRSGATGRFARVEQALRTSAATMPSWELELCSTREALDGILDSAEHSGFDGVVAVGGDGTVSEIGRRMIGRRLSLGIVPAGSGNGLARHLGIPMEPAAAIDSLTRARHEVVDTASLNGTPFLTIAGVGFDAVVAERFAASTQRGLLTYVREGATAFSQFSLEQYSVQTAGADRSGKAFLVAVANASQYGNNARIAPLASLQDGLLDVTIIRDVTLSAAPRILFQLFNGTLDSCPQVESFRTDSITIVRNAAGAAHIDGETLTLGTELDFRIVPSSLRVLVPAETKKI